MFAEYFEAGGPVMYVVLAAWVVVFAGVLDRLLYLIGRARRRPVRHIESLLRQGGVGAAREALAAERELGDRGLRRIDAVSQIATSIGLFGTVLGIARSFFARGGDLGLAAPDVLASGLATALFTTLAGLVVFLFGQGFLIAFEDLRDFFERGVDARVDSDARTAGG
jgi:biopolymer transport protein ExbB/TolQ